MREAGSSVEIGGGDAHKIVHVLRLKDGDSIEIVDSSGTLYAAILSLDGNGVRATLARSEVLVQGNEPAGPRFDVAQALPKSRKMDFVVEKATELGAAAILPFACERTIARDAGEAKLERWRRLARAAAQQCGRRDVPHISATIPSFDALLGHFGEYDAVLFPWELAAHTLLRERLPELLRDARRALIVVGPEGGFTHAEAEAAEAHGASLLWLGPRILRTETAAIVLLAIAEALAQGRN